jgi:poly(3-hydroxyalkanoate) synthetase
MFSITKMFFFIIQSAQKYNNNKKKLWPKDSNQRHRGRRLCTLPLRRWLFDSTRCSAWYHSFAVATDIFNNFFWRKAGVLGQKKKYVSNEIN